MFVWLENVKTYSYFCLLFVSLNNLRHLTTLLSDKRSFPTEKLKVMKTLNIRNTNKSQKLSEKEATRTEQKWRYQQTYLLFVLSFYVSLCSVMSGAISA